MKISIHLIIIIIIIIFFSLFAGCTSNCTEYYPNITINKVGEKRIPILFSSDCKYEIEYEIVNHGMAINDTILFEIKMIDRKSGDQIDNKIVTISTLGDFEHKRGIETLRGKCWANYDYNCVIYPTYNCVE